MSLSHFVKIKSEELLPRFVKLNRSQYDKTKSKTHVVNKSLHITKPGREFQVGEDIAQTGNSTFISKTLKVVRVLTVSDL
jgi:hypothetical protein